MRRHSPAMSHEELCIFVVDLARVVDVLVNGYQALIDHVANAIDAIDEKNLRQARFLLGEIAGDPEIVNVRPFFSAAEVDRGRIH